MHKKMSSIFVLLAMLVSSIFFLNAAYSLSKSTQINTISYNYIFSKNDHFNVAFAEYPKGEEAFYELNFQEGAALPPEIKLKRPALKISGNNHSADLFMYAYKKLSGLQANTTYHVDFSLEFASNAATDAMGVGGSPGASVYVKIGAVNQAPRIYMDNHNYYRMKLDKGEQSNDGKDMLTLGTVGVETQDARYQLKTLPFKPDPQLQKKMANYAVTSNTEGEVWLIFGTDSGFESTTTIFYTRVVATFKKLRQTKVTPGL